MLAGAYHHTGRTQWRNYGCVLESYEQYSNRWAGSYYTDMEFRNTNQHSNYCMYTFSI